jgi:hypothetical protein
MSSDSEIRSRPKRASHQVDEICDRFEYAWQTGQNPCIETYLSEVDDSIKTVLLRQLLFAEWNKERRRCTFRG